MLPLSALSRYGSLATFSMLATLSATSHSADDFTFYDDTFMDEAVDPIPVVLTTSRLHQPQSEVPASVTIIDREMIEMLGTREIPELLRLVPGMAVADVNGNEPSVSYHATNSKDIKRMQVMIDGRSVYQAGLARVLWNDLPFTVDDIERIEVTRGPNAAAYGPNSFSGVINIITRHTHDTLGLKAGISSGNNGFKDISIQAGSEIGNVSYRLSAFGRGDNGYSENEEGLSRRDKKYTKGFNFKSTAQISASTHLDFQFGMADSTLQRPHIGSWENFGTQGSYPDQLSDNHFMNVVWETAFSDTHSLSLQLYRNKSSISSDWQTCMYSEGLGAETNLLFTEEAYLLREFYRGLTDDETSYVTAGLLAKDIEQLTEAVAAVPGLLSSPSVFQSTLQSQGATALGRPLFAEEAALLTRAGNIALAQNGDIPLLCGTVDTSLVEERTDFEVVDRLKLNDHLRTVSGIGIRRETVDSTYYMNGKESSHSYRLFAHIEYRPVESLVFNLGGHYEGSNISDSDYSPRFAVNYHLHQNHTLRLVRSKATRSIDIYEHAAAPRVVLDNLNAPYRNHTQALLGESAATFYMREDMNDDLESETIDALELGYYGYINHQLEIDIRIFEENLDKLISKGINILEFEPNNNYYADLQGAETQIRWRPGNNDLLILNAAYIDNEENTKIEHRLTAKGSGMFMWNHRFDNELNLNLAYHLADKYNPFGSLGGLKFERLDLGIQKRFRIQDSHIKLSLKAMHRLNDNPIVTGDNNYPSQNSYFFSLETEI